uniref:DUF4781 domain-containing protein n=1 Tax=Acrobeloides nanus TaxID=290746 RepID=A0A914EQC1_9BILA
MSITTLSYNPPMSYIPVEYPKIEELIEDDDSDSETATENEKLNKDAIALNWALNSEALQQVLYTRLGNRIFDEYSIEESEYLEVKIAYAKFGPPDIANNDPENLISYEEFQNTYHFEEKQNSNIIQAYSSLYSKEQRKKAKKTINLILDLIKKQNPEAKTFKVAFIFLVYQLGSTDQCGLIPIIRVLREEGDPEDNAWYIDQENRAYDTWKEFLEGNRLPKMRICYPKNGYYSVNENGYSIFMPEESVIVGFGMTPAAKISRKILRTLDWTTSGILIGTLGIAVASALSAPISVPILTTAAIGSGIAAFYGASRSGATLVDRKLHAQSINVTNAEARSCWIGIGSSIFSVSFSSASMLVHRVVAISHSIGASTVYTVNGLHTGALIFSGAGVANQSHHIGKKIYKRQRVTAFEVMELALSTFLFSNSLISFKTANIQLMDQQQQQLQPQTAPTATQTAAPTAAQTAAPTAAPSTTHVAAPTATQTAAPSATQAAAPTAAQTAAPTATQTAAPASTATQTQTATTQHVPVNIDNSQQQNQSQSQTSASGNTSGQHGFVDKLVNNVNADNVSDKHSKIIRTLNAIQNPNEFFAKSLEITKQVNRLAGSVVNKDKSKISEKEAHSDLVASSSENLTLSSCDSSKTLSDKDISIDSSKSVSTKVYTSKIEEILLNDYKFLAMIKLENKGIEEIGRLETRIRMSFYTIHTKDFTPELVKMCILISKHL